MENIDSGLQIARKWASLDVWAVMIDDTIDLDTDKDEKRNLPVNSGR